MFSRGLRSIVGGVGVGAKVVVRHQHQQVRFLNMLAMGAPGVGKGSFGKKISPHFNIPIISTGDIVRDQIARETPLGLEIKDRTAQGLLVDDELVTELVRARFTEDEASVAKGYILDGFPRTRRQAELFAEFPEHFKVDLVLNIVLPQEVLVEKACARRACEDCGEGYNLADISLGDIQMDPLLPKVEGVCDKCGGKLMQRADDTEQVRECVCVCVDVQNLCGSYIHSTILFYYVGGHPAPGNLQPRSRALARLLQGSRPRG
jgi:adenylate kinase family enzyme